MSLEKKDGGEVDKINGERVEEIIQRLDKAGEQGKDINTAKMGATRKHLYNEKMSNFILQYNQILGLFNELDPDYKTNHPEIFNKLKSTLEKFKEYEEFSRYEK